jgi:hypothetical protein
MDGRIVKLYPVLEGGKGRKGNQPEGNERLAGWLVGWLVLPKNTWSTYVHIQSINQQQTTDSTSGGVANRSRRSRTANKASGRQGRKVHLSLASEYGMLEELEDDVCMYGWRTSQRMIQGTCTYLHVTTLRLTDEDDETPQTWDETYPGRPRAW